MSNQGNYIGYTYGEEENYCSHCIFTTSFYNEWLEHEHLYPGHRRMETSSPDNTSVSSNSPSAAASPTTNPSITPPPAATQTSSPSEAAESYSSSSTGLLSLASSDVCPATNSSTNPHLNSSPIPGKITTSSFKSAQNE